MAALPSFGRPSQAQPDASGHGRGCRHCAWRWLTGHSITRGALSEAFRVQWHRKASSRCALGRKRRAGFGDGGCQEVLGVWARNWPRSSHRILALHGGELSERSASRTVASGDDYARGRRPASYGGAQSSLLLRMVPRGTVLRHLQSGALWPAATSSHAGRSVPLADSLPLARDPSRDAPTPSLPVANYRL
jgi:hypothetical protein